MAVETQDAMLEVNAEVCGTTLSVSKRNLENDDFTDPCFFDEDYSPAAATGFVVWEGTWLFVKLMQDLHWRRRFAGKRVVEMGAGIGLAGLAAAAAGAHVLQTDLPSVVAGSIQPNINRNAKTPFSEPQQARSDVASQEVNCISGSPWAGALRVGMGSTVAMAMDWCKPLDVQCLDRHNDPRHADVILAVETVWLAELIHPFVSMAAAILRGPNRPQCYFINGERATESSKTFARMSQVMDAFEAEGCGWEQMMEVDSDEYLKPTKIFQVWLRPE